MIISFEPGKATFVRYECGCVGLRLDESNVVSIKSCDTSHDENEFQFWVSHRKFEDKAWKPLSTEEVDTLVETLGRLVMDGYKFREIKRLLNG